MKSDFFQQLLSDNTSTNSAMEVAMVDSALSETSEFIHIFPASGSRHLSTPSGATLRRSPWKTHLPKPSTLRSLRFVMFCCFNRLISSDFRGPSNRNIVLNVIKSYWRLATSFQCCEMRVQSKTISILAVHLGFVFVQTVFVRMNSRGFFTIPVITNR